jgi:hypothetical protein
MVASCTTGCTMGDFGGIERGVTAGAAAAAAAAAAAPGSALLLGGGVGEDEICTVARQATPRARGGLC